MFWGKIFGDQKDYIILKATNTHLQLQKKYYFRLDNPNRICATSSLDCHSDDDER